MKSKFILSDNLLITKINFHVNEANLIFVYDSLA